LFTPSFNFKISLILADGRGYLSLVLKEVYKMKSAILLRAIFSYQLAQERKEDEKNG
jgi:hypothetical protein